MKKQNDEQMITALRDGLHGLHLARLELVGEAKALRLAWRMAEREKVWARVEEITAQIEVTTRELAEHMLREENAAARWTELGVKVWRDPAVDMPYDDIVVMVKVDDDENPIRFVFRDGDGWYGAHEGLRLAVAVLCWMYVPEAVEILDAARKAVAHLPDDRRSGE